MDEIRPREAGGISWWFLRVRDGLVETQVRHPFTI